MSLLSQKQKRVEEPKGGIEYKNYIQQGTQKKKKKKE